MAVEALGASLACLTGLQHLAGLGLWRESSIFAPYLSILTSLRHLDLHVGKGGAVALAGSLRCLTALQCLVLKGGSSDPDSHIEAAGGAALAAGLHCLTGLQHLELWRVQLGDDGAAALMPGLGSLTGLQQLKLGNNSIQLAGAGLASVPSQACNIWTWGAIISRMTGRQRLRLAWASSRA